MGSSTRDRFRGQGRSEWVTCARARVPSAVGACVDMETAFNALNRHGRNHNRKLSELALDVVRGRIDPATVATGRPSK